MKRKHFDTHEGDDETILRPMSELPHFTQLAVMADGAGCVKKGILAQLLPTKNNSRESGLFVMTIHSPL